MQDKEFARRLVQACEGHPHVPPYGQGRQAWIKENMRVSHEAVSRWFKGDSRPRPNRMEKLARILEVDEAWLALGVTPSASPPEARRRKIQGEGVVNVFIGLAQLNGAVVALPDSRDPRAPFVDFYAMFKGEHVPFHICLAEELAAGTFRLTLPKEYPQCIVVGAVPTGSMRVDYVPLPTQQVQEHSVRRGGYFELIVSQQGHRYVSGRQEWIVVEDFNVFRDDGERHLQ